MRSKYMSAAIMEIHLNTNMAADKRKQVSIEHVAMASKRLKRRSHMAAIFLFWETTFETNFIAKRNEKKTHRRKEISKENAFLF